MLENEVGVHIILLEKLVEPLVDSVEWNDQHSIPLGVLILVKGLQIVEKVISDLLGENPVQVGL